MIMESKLTTLMVERIEEQMAVLETKTGGLITLPLSLLPDTIREGQFLDIEVKFNTGMESSRRQEISDLQRELLENN